MSFADLRQDFPILKRLVRGKPLAYLDNAATSQKPRQVIEALVDFYENHNANVHRGVHTLSEESTSMVEAVRAKVADFIKAPKPETVIFTRNATESINLVAHAWGRKFLKPGDEIVLTEMEHHSNIVPWQLLAEEKGVKLRFVPVEPDGTLDLEKVKAAMTPKTRLFSFTAVSNALGTVNPVQEMISIGKAAGATVLVDACQWAPHRPIDVGSWGADFIAFSAHKMLGPTGIGVLWGREELLEAMDPFLGGGDMISRVTLEKSQWNALPFKFEAGTPNFADAAAFGPALDYLNAVGLDVLRKHEEALAAKARAMLEAEPAVTLLGPEDPARRSGVVSFNIAGLHPHDVGTVFDLEGVAIRVGHHCCQPLMRKLKCGGTARASFYLYNDESDLEAMARALKRTLEFFKVAPQAGAR
ncbi:MAG: cysteine desulfurase [Elusimicrobia bacterium RBG_16_66_12]|nr:MAG: cysteine desulfurase [Elusimicrobia bacterium RBG_16_66_12]